MYILGINAYHGDASAALINDGQIVLAMEEERLNRLKHCAGFPKLAIKACLNEAGITLADVDHIAISTDPSANLKNKVLYSVSRITKIHNMLRKRLSKVGKTRDLISILSDEMEVPKEHINAEVHNVEHHLAHMASCFYISPFDEAAILTLDGMGDFVSTKWGTGNGNSINIIGQVEYPHSLGYIYTAITQYLGFPYYGDEGKVMGLAPYGSTDFLDEFKKILTPNVDIGFRLNMDYFLHHEQGIEMQWEDGQPKVGRMYSDRMSELFGMPPRKKGDKLSQFHKDVAASLQRHLEIIILDMMTKLSNQTESTILCLAGGVALNSVMNGKIRNETPFEEVYIHPNAGDGGTSLGAAYYVWNNTLYNPKPKPVEHAYLGLNYTDQVVENELKKQGYEPVRLDDEELFRQTASLIADGNVVGWFQGRMEWGPRALGSRSIVVDPRRSDMKDILNQRIKRREPFRPFAPSILQEYTDEYFEQNYPAPSMLMVYDIKKEKQSVIPAVTHVDGSGRLQTVHRFLSPTYYGLIEAFHKQTGVPVLLNTSFNENEPIVCTPADAIACFKRTKMDVLAINNYIIKKEKA